MDVLPDLTRLHYCIEVRLQHGVRDESDRQHKIPEGISSYINITKVYPSFFLLYILHLRPAGGGMRLRRNNV